MNVTDRLRSLLSEGHSRDGALGALRQAGASPFQCIRAIAETENVGVGEAKRIFSSSPSWADYVRANDEALIQELENQRAIRQCLEYVLRSGQLTGEFETRMGVTEPEVVEVLAAWPFLDDGMDDSVPSLAIDNALNEVCHGLSITQPEWLQ